MFTKLLNNMNIKVTVIINFHLSNSHYNKRWVGILPVIHLIKKKTVLLVFNIQKYSCCQFGMKLKLCYREGNFVRRKNKDYMMCCLFGAAYMVYGASFFSQF